jgi:dTMP kinase
MPAGRLIVFEGPEGVGKTTQLRRLERWLGARGVRWLGLREPGSTGVGNEIRRLVLEPGRELAPRTEALLFMAARAELLEREVRPALLNGKVVLLDRFFLSTYAYQVHGRELPEPEVRMANLLATQGLRPDLTLLLTLPVAEGMARVARRGTHDRMEAAPDGFHARVAAAFAAFAEPAWQEAHAECGPIVAVDASGSEDDVEARVRRILSRRWPETFGGAPESDLVSAPTRMGGES